MREIQGRAKRTRHVIDVPNLVEIQLNSYRWFLEEGLKELFDSFSPIYDFSGKNSLSLIDFVLGEPKYSMEECRERDLTFESPIKAKVLLRLYRDETSGPEEIESEVYLGDLPLMTDKGTFIINGAERVVVSQLSRSPGVYFEDWLDLSGQVLFRARLIPQEGNWLEVETDPQHQIMAHIVGSARKVIPLTMLLRALQVFPEAHEPIQLTLGQALENLWVYKQVEGADGKEAEKDYFFVTRFAKPVVAPTDIVAQVDKTTGEIAQYTTQKRSIDSKHYKAQVVHVAGEILAEENAPATYEVLQSLAKKLGSDFVVSLYSPVGSTEEIVRAFSKVTVIENPTPEQLVGCRPAADILDKKGKVLVRATHRIPDKTVAKAVVDLKLPSIEVLEVNPYVEATLEQDTSNTPEEALIEIYRKLKPGDPVSLESAKSLLQAQFYDVRRYDLARVGRYKVNKKLGIQVDLKCRVVTKEDLVGILRYIINLSAGVGSTDDIDHLENKRIRSVGEQLCAQLRLGFQRMEKVVKERMTASENINLQFVMATKPISASIKSFFGSSQLSQFMDQTNPLAELVSKRRLSALGQGGLSRQNAKLEVRDVHHSHYGRICPIETPEGPNIGLIGSMAVYARVDEFGFLETPYRKVKEGVVTDEIVWMTADQDHRYYIAPANIPLDEDGRIRDEYVQVRYEDGYPTVHRSQVQYMDVAPVQLVSIATALIPFIENNEATRALMGANMQRQAVPTLRPQAPLVKTGMERRAALDSGAVVRARRSGVVTRVTSEQIDVTTPDGRVDSYYLLNMLRSNNSTCITQRPIVRKGQHVRQGQVLTDGPCVENGELALGQNVLVAFMPWGGFNFEDAILISERLVKDDVYTSIHIEEFDTEARDTKLGPEEITRDIPNVGEDTLSDLDENGIIRVGAEVRPDDILVGKVAPKGQGELTAEERLIIAIFGKKAEETRDVSLRVPHGNGGRVIDVKVFSRYKYQGARDGRVYNFCKRPEPGMRDSQDGELLRLPQDELPVGVNMLVRVYVAQKRKIMEGDKMAGRHGNKGVISKILPVEDMPFLPDGTPVDIVLNPLGVPSRMNIGQILETHLGYVAQHLNCSFVNPSFEGMTESEIIEQMEILGAKFWRERLQKYLNSELRLYVSLDSVEPFNEFVKVYREQHPLPDDAALQNGQATPEQAEQARALYEAYIRRLLEPVREALMERSEEDLKRLSQLLAAADTNTASHEEVVEAIVQKIEENCRARVGFDPHTGKSWVRDGLTGETFDMPVTVGVIYMLKLAHLVDDKIHARSTGPYSLVTQQPLGGKAMFGGQRFGEMEVWALEAYGAAYTLQEILTIKSDDIQGRVKTYEAIVKGDTILEPGVPESFKILVNELQSLCLKVTVLNDKDEPIDLNAGDDDIDPGEDPAKAAARRQQRALREHPRDDYDI
jgi:DNA-directed RNA polymerase subunit beta